jgi:hypothetical protein
MLCLRPSRLFLLHQALRKVDERVESSQTFPTSTMSWIMYYTRQISSSTSRTFSRQRHFIPLTSKHQGQCMLKRLARHQWRDHILSSLGWYPWQCCRCHRTSYLRFRF